MASSKLAVAADFSASINENEIGYRQKIKLALKLVDGHPKGQPDLSSIRDNFEILSTSNYSSTKIINGDYSVEHQWIYTLRPLKKGRFKLGPFTIDTKSGIESTNEISINVLDTKVNSSSKQPNSGRSSFNNIFITTEVSKDDPYKKEPFIFHVRLFTDTNMYGITRGSLEVDNAIVAQVGDAKTYEKTHNRRKYMVIEWRFHITPLKAGQLEIPEVEVFGKVTAEDSRPSIDRLFDSPFGNNFDDYAFDSLTLRKSEKFHDFSNKVIVNVQDSNDSVNPWLPAKGLKLHEEWDNTSFEAGTPFTRIISIHASGMLASQLPDINVESEPGKYKIFSDPGKVTENIENNLITSSKEIKLTYIPQEHGSTIIPEIKIEYWNVDKKQVESTNLPERQINVTLSPEELQSEASISTDLDNLKDIIIGKEVDIDSPEELRKSDSQQTFHIIIAAIAGMLITLIGCLVIFMLSRRRTQNISRVNIITGNNVSLNDKKITNVPVVHNIDDAQRAGDIQKLIQDYANTNWQLPKNLSVYSILLQLKSKYPEFDYNQYKVISDDLNKALYAGGKVDLELLRQLSKDLIKHMNDIIDRSNKKPINKAKKLPKINPS